MASGVSEVKVVELPVTNLQDTVAMLRALADDIETGKSENARQAVLVIEREGDQPRWSVYDFGLAANNPMRAVGVLECGIQMLIDKVLGG